MAKVKYFTPLKSGYCLESIDNPGWFVKLESGALVLLSGIQKRSIWNKKDAEQMSKVLIDDGVIRGTLKVVPIEEVPGREWAKVI